MNEESLAKYVKALPDKMLSEYDAAAAGGGTGAAVNAAGTKSSGVRDNKNRFPFLGPLLVIIAAVVTVAVVVVVQSRNKKSSTDPSATAYQLSEPTATPDSTEFVTDLPETRTAAPTEIPTATFTPAPTEIPDATFTPAPTDIATLPAPTEPETNTPDPSNILDRPFCIIQNGRKIYPYYAGELRTPKHSESVTYFVDNLPEDLSQIKENAPIVYTDVPFSFTWTVEPYSKEWREAMLFSYEFDWILEQGTDGTDTNKLNRVFDSNASRDLNIQQLLPNTDYPGRKRYMALIIHDERISPYDMLFPSYVFCFVQGGPDTTPSPQPTATPAPDPDHVKVNHLDPIITKGELYVGDTLQLSYLATPEN
ncbi:MAG: hypothetical protein J6Y21_01010, partial [Clostridia bacterium]|nr:hypothetical protein [Clostridia bacterium]